MKITSSILTLCLVISSSAFAHNNEHPHPAMKNDIQKLKKRNQNLRQRIQGLEASFKMLQEEVSSLKAPSTNSVRIYGCLIRTPFDGSFFAKRNSQLEAKAVALSKCEKANGTMKCKSAKVECAEEIINI